MGKLAACVATLLAAACGRIGYDHRTGGDDTDGPGPTPDTPAATCPSDTRPIASGVLPNTGVACIEIDERGNDTWLNATAACEGLGRRLCTDAEWLFACQNTSGLNRMAGGIGTDWEWMADKVDALTAKKRGYDLCTDESSHEIDNGGYFFRCCVDL